MRIPARELGDSWRSFSDLNVYLESFILMYTYSCFYLQVTDTVMKLFSLSTCMPYQYILIQQSCIDIKMKI